jgi:hypothetical protein
VSVFLCMGAYERDLMNVRVYMQKYVYVYVCVRVCESNSASKSVCLSKITISFQRTGGGDLVLLHGEKATEHHWLGLLIAWVGLLRGGLLQRDGVADSRVRDLFDAPTQPAHLTRKECFHLTNSATGVRSQPTRQFVVQGTHPKSKHAHTHTVTPIRMRVDSHYTYTNCYTNTYTHTSMHTP